MNNTARLRRGLILVNAYSESESEMNQPTRLASELNSLGIKAEIKRNNYFPAVLNGDIFCPVKDSDFVVYLDKDKYVSDMLERSGVRLFNRHEAIRICDDKVKTFICLSNAGVRMPKTLPGLLCYNGDGVLSRTSIDRIEEELSYPIVVKESYGSLGKGVYLVESRGELIELTSKLKGVPHMFQEYIAFSRGRDVRIIVIGGKVVGGMLRTSDSDFRSNISLGGRAEPFEVTKEMKALAEKVANILGLDYCGVDMLFSENGPLVCEVNSNAFFGGFEKITGINVAAIYAQHIQKTIYG
ncbi:MAG: RimK family alpha-L-glutamate ligase [Clostridia bacterium]|nr:RimK family alpha-L-glutamate ligase [Clostridia bacterium]